MNRLGFKLSALLITLLGALSGCRQPGIAVLYSDTDPSEMRVRCPHGTCDYLTLNEMDCEEPSPHFDVVIVDGHSEPPMYLDTTAPELADKLACLSPSLVVLDTCHGFSAPLLRAIAERVPDALVVGSTDKIWMDGLNYDAVFFDPAPPEERARHVTPRLGEAVYEWHPNVEELDAMQSDLDQWSREQLQGRLVHTLPNLVRAPSRDGSREVLFVVPPERFR